jgi:hypothetical protein
MPHPERLSRGFFLVRSDASGFYNKSRTQLFKSSNPSSLRLALTVLSLSGLSRRGLSLSMTCGPAANAADSAQPRASCGSASCAQPMGGPPCAHPRGCAVGVHRGDARVWTSPYITQPQIYDGATVGAQSSDKFNFGVCTQFEGSSYRAPKCATAVLVATQAHPQWVLKARVDAGFQEAATESRYSLATGKTERSLSLPVRVTVKSY